MCKNYTRAVGRQHFKKYKVMVIFTWFYNVKLKPHVQTTPIVHSFGYIFIKLIIEIKKKISCLGSQEFRKYCLTNSRMYFSQFFFHISKITNSKSHIMS